MDRKIDERADKEPARTDGKEWTINSKARRGGARQPGKAMHLGRTNQEARGIRN